MPKTWMKKAANSINGAWLDWVYQNFPASLYKETTEPPTDEDVAVHMDREFEDMAPNSDEAWIEKGCKLPRVPKCYRTKGD